MNPTTPAAPISVVFVGNCQAESLAAVYRTWLAPQRGETAHWVPTFTNATEDGAARIRGADVIAMQVTDVDQVVSLADFRTNARIVRFPMITAFFLWPFSGGAHPADADIPAPYRKPFSHEFGDRWLDREIGQGADAQTLVDRYESLDVLAVVNLDRFVELGIATQKARDAQSDMSFCDCIMGQLAEHRPFIQPHHPSLEMFNRLARETYARIGCSQAEIDAALAHGRHSPFSLEEVPVHPRIAAYFGLRWAVPELKYHCPLGVRMTWVQFCRRYVAHDWGENLQRCLARATKTATTEEATELAAALEAAVSQYESAEGYGALGAIRRRLGQPDAALTAIEQALIADPMGWKYQVWRVHLLLALGRLTDALAAAEDVAAWQPHVVDAVLALAEAHFQLGDAERAACIARRVLATNPTHPYVLAKVEAFERRA